MTETDAIVARIMRIRNGMTSDADAEAVVRQEIDALCGRVSAETETARRKERISMAREICLYQGANPNFIDSMGQESWEKYEPLAGACIREAERLFALRCPAQTPADTYRETVGKVAAARERRMAELRCAADWLRWGLEEIVRCTEPKAGSGDRFICGIACEALAAAGFDLGAAGIQKPTVTMSSSDTSTDRTSK